MGFCIWKELRFKVSCHQFHPSWQQRTLWRDKIQPYKLGTQNIAQLLLSLSLAFDLSSMKQQWLQIQIPDSLVNIANERHVSPSHHLSVTLRMLVLALTQLGQKTQFIEQKC